MGMTVRPKTPRSDSSARLEARALAVQPVQHDEARAASSSSAACPHLLGRHLDAGHRVDDHQRRIRDAQRGARVAEEVRHPRRVDEIDLAAVPLGVGEAGGEGVLAGDFFFVVVGDRGAFVDLPSRLTAPASKSSAEMQLRLAGAAMADQGDVSEARRRRRPSWRSSEAPASRVQLPALSITL